MDDYSLHTFANGIRWIHKQVKHTQVAHCGIMLDIGSRDEAANELGLAHFWEHMAFKGTKSRNSRYILNRIDSLGGELNAYTTKEKICFHASLLNKNVEKAIELLADITFNSAFPEKEIEKERQVILEEMNMYADTPEDDIQDKFDDTIFPENPLGNNILGTKESVNSFRQQHFSHFVNAHINTRKLVVSTLSKDSPKKLFPLIEKYIGNIQAIYNHNTRATPTVPSKKIEIIKKPIHQAHCMLGRTAYNLTHENRIPFFMLVNMLGGPAMNARLNMAVREKHGLVYNIDAHYVAYTDTGLFSIYFGTEKKNVNKAIRLVHHELEKLIHSPIAEAQLKAAKNQIKGQLAISEENNNGMMLTMAKSLLDYGYIESLPQIFERIDAIKSTQLNAIAAEMFAPNQLSTLIYEPEN